MKKLFLLSAATFIAFGSIQAQTTVALKSKIKQDKAEEKMLKKQMKEYEKTLKKLKILKGSDVSYQAKQAFGTDFGNLTATSWERRPNFDVVTFAKDGHETTAYYDSDAKLVGTVSDKTFADLPGNAQASIEKKYPGYQPEKVIFFDDNEANETDMILFDRQFQDEDNYFVELRKAGKTIIVEVNMTGDVSYFTAMK